MPEIRIAFLVLLFSSLSCQTDKHKGDLAVEPESQASIFHAPDTGSIPKTETGELIRYGMRLIQNTAEYIGPNGRISQNTRNVMSCSNCHLQNGTKAYGLNFFTTYRSYPQFRGRENRVLNLADRINNCIERPHNGIALPADSKEILAISAYIKWVGEQFDEKKHHGQGLRKLEYSGLSASSVRGELIYTKHCQICHMKNGEGVFSADRSRYEYPPLWGDWSYQESSSLHRVIKAARFILYNMPNLSSSWEKPVLTVQEALDVAAFINDGKRHKRPKSTQLSYPDPKHKPIDYFKGPYLDPFPDTLHTFGPWDSIIDFYKSRNLSIVE